MFANTSLLFGVFANTSNTNNVLECHLWVFPYGMGMGMTLNLWYSHMWASAGFCGFMCFPVGMGIEIYSHANLEKPYHDFGWFDAFDTISFDILNSFHFY